MLTDKEIAKISTEYGLRFEAVNVKYIELVGKHIRQLGKLTPTDIHRLQQLQIMGGNIKEINKMLAKESRLSVKNLSKLYGDMLKDEYAYVKELYIYKKGIQIPLKMNKKLQAHLKSMQRLTAGTFENLSNTTVISKQYQKILSEVIQELQSGVKDYESIVRQVIKKHNPGARVTYQSGLTRRLDSAVRMNVTGGLRQHNIGIRQIMGEQFGADGVEISAHALCAPDHIPIQGEQFAIGAGREVDGVIYDSYEQMNDSLVRHIGEMNCKHYTMPIILGISPPANSPELLQEYKEYSEKEVIIGGKKYTRYECSQLQRELETKMRYKKDNIIFSRSAGASQTVKESERELKKLQAKYRDVSNKSQLAMQYNRAYVPGYR